MSMWLARQGTSLCCHGKSNKIGNQVQSIGLEADQLHENVHGILCELAPMILRAKAMLPAVGRGLHAAVDTLAIHPCDADARPIYICCAPEGAPGYIYCCWR